MIIFMCMKYNCFFLKYDHYESNGMAFITVLTVFCMETAVVFVKYILNVTFLLCEQGLVSLRPSRWFTQAVRYLAFRFGWPRVQTVGHMFADQHLYNLLSDNLASLNSYMNQNMVQIVEQPCIRIVFRQFANILIYISGLSGNNVIERSRGQPGSQIAKYSFR